MNSTDIFYQPMLSEIIDHDVRETQMQKELGRTAVEWLVEWLPLFASRLRTFAFASCPLEPEWHDRRRAHEGHLLRPDPP